MRSLRRAACIWVRSLARGGLRGASGLCLGSRAAGSLYLGWRPAEQGRGGSAPSAEGAGPALRVLLQFLDFKF